MRIAVGILACIALWSTRAAADTYYKYHDKRTGRDVYVNRLEQVPQKYRSQAQVVLEGAEGPAKPDPGADASPEVTAPPAPAAPQPVQRSAAPVDLASNLRQAITGTNLLHDIPAMACAMIDFRLAASGAKPLGAPERHDLGSLVLTVLIAALVASLASLVAWITVIVIAVRDEHPWWALFTFIFYPVGYLYLLIHGGPGHILRRSLCALGMLSPLLVGAIGAWRFYATLQAIMQARGLHL
jgi:hypothetical protein